MKIKSDIINSVMKSPCAHLNQHLCEPLAPNKKGKQPATNRGRKEKAWITLNAGQWAKENKLILSQEVEFAPGRKYRFDWVITDKIEIINKKPVIPEDAKFRLAIEYNGIFSEKSRHTTVTGYTGDMNKLNLAQSLGYDILQFTPLNYLELWRSLEKYKPQ